jgi:hypothetical protein
MGASGAADPAGQAGRASAPDEYAREAINAIFYCCAPDARGAIFRATGSRRARPSTTSSAISRRTAFGRRRLHMDLREDMERAASPAAAVIDSSSLKSAEKGVVVTV